MTGKTDKDLSQSTSAVDEADLSKLRQEVAVCRAKLYDVQYESNRIQWLMMAGDCHD